MRAHKMRAMAVLLVAGGAVVLAASGASAAPTATATPSTGLTNGTVVHISGSGFTAGKQLGVTQCSDQGEQTGAGDCDLGKIKTVTADASGKATIDYTVSAGPFGQNNRVCDATHKCVLSLGELSADPNAERAVMNVTFGGASTSGGSTAVAATGAPIAQLAGFGLVLLVIGTVVAAAARPARRRA